MKFCRTTIQDLCFFDEFIFSENVSEKRILNFNFRALQFEVLQNVGEKIVFISVDDASQVESLVNVPVVKELVFRVHVKGRSNLVHVIS